VGVTREPKAFLIPPVCLSPIARVVTGKRLKRFREADTLR
jgi:hypothetical protein